MRQLIKKLPEFIRKPFRSQLVPTEIHIEQIKKTKVQLFHFLKAHPKTMVMPTFSPTKPNNEEFRIYKKLIEVYPNPVGLHVHICDDINRNLLPLPSKQKQKDAIKSGLDALDQIANCTLIDFVSGHWSYNQDTLQVCKEIGLTKIHIKLKEIPKVTFSNGFPLGLQLIPVVRHIHDYDI